MKSKLHQDLSTAESRPAEDPQAELERQELFSQLSASEARAAKLEQQTTQMVKQARLDAEQKTLEDVEEIIQNLEDGESAFYRRSKTDAYENS